jgi:tetratricopeptide (TPR) repeat protein
MTRRVALLAIALCVVMPMHPTVAHAQSPAEHIAEGVSERNANPAGALKHFEAALAVDSNSYDALIKAADAAVEAGQLLSSDKAARTAMYKKAEQYARHAVALNPNDAEGHFQLARAIGRNALTMGSRDKVKYAGEVRTHAMEALRLNPRHDGALHIMGVWNAEVMRLSGIERFMAKNFLGGKIFDSANWDDAQRYLEEAVQIAPTRLTHRIDLAQVYADRGDKAKAREQIDYILHAPNTEASDPMFKREATELLAKVR